MFVLPNLFTVSSIFCGVYSITLSAGEPTGDNFYRAAVAIFFGSFFDAFDGRVARLTRTQSDFGVELDSLADVISFGVAPALIAYGCGMQGLYDRVILTAFVACGVSRLARYNVTAEAFSEEGQGKVKYFEGTPIPTSLLLVFVLFMAARQGALHQSLWFGKVVLAGFTLHTLVLMFALSGSLMVSRIRIPKL